MVFLIRLKFYLDEKGILFTFLMFFFSADKEYKIYALSHMNLVNTLKVMLVNYTRFLLYLINLTFRWVEFEYPRINLSHIYPIYVILDTMYIFFFVKVHQMVRMWYSSG